MAVNNPEKVLNAIEAKETALNDEAVKKLREKVGDVTVELNEPFEWCGKTYEKIKMNFGNMTGADVEALEDELTDMRISTQNPAGNRKYLRYLAARAAGVPADMIPALPIDKYNQITDAAQRFLIVTG